MALSMRICGIGRDFIRVCNDEPAFLLPLAKASAVDRTFFSLVCASSSSQTLLKLTTPWPSSFNSSSFQPGVTAACCGGTSAVDAVSAPKTRIAAALASGCECMLSDPTSEAKESSGRSNCTETT